MPGIRCEGIERGQLVVGEEGPPAQGGPLDFHLLGPDAGDLLRVSEEPPPDDPLHRTEARQVLLPVPADDFLLRPCPLRGIQADGPDVGRLDRGGIPAGGFQPVDGALDILDAGKEAEAPRGGVVQLVKVGRAPEGLLVLRFVDHEKVGSLLSVNGLEPAAHPEAGAQDAVGGVLAVVPPPVLFPVPGGDVGPDGEQRLRVGGSHFSPSAMGRGVRRGSPRDP